MKIKSIRGVAKKLSIEGVPTRKHIMNKTIKDNIDYFYVTYTN